MAESEIRRNPFTNELIIYSPARQKRPDRKEEYCPLCSGSEEVPEFKKPLRIPNKYPSLDNREDFKKVKTGTFFEKSNPYGFCELVVYTKKHDAMFIDLNEEEILAIFIEWRDATMDFAKDSNIKYILPFENYGEDVGATLIHPHGQIYGFPFIPPIIEKEFNTAVQYQKESKQCMVCDYIVAEKEEKERIIYEDDHIIGIVPYFAKYAYDVYIYPKRHYGLLHHSTQREKESFSNLLPKVIQSMNSIFNKKVSYSLSLNQSPLNTPGSAAFHMYFKIYTPQRNKGSLKLLGAVETSGGTFINGTLPEQAAKSLRNNLE